MSKKEEKKQKLKFPCEMCTWCVGVINPKRENLEDYICANDFSPKHKLGTSVKGDTEGCCYFEALKEGSEHRTVETVGTKDPLKDDNPCHGCMGATFGDCDDCIHQLYKEPEHIHLSDPKLEMTEEQKKEAFDKQKSVFLARGNTKSQEAKADLGKPKITKCPTDIIRAISYIREYGDAKYSPDSWKQVEPQRYRDAMMRHALAYIDNPYGVDEESGFPHLWHLACNVAFLCYFDKDQFKEML